LETITQNLNITDALRDYWRHEEFMDAMTRGFKRRGEIIDNLCEAFLPLDNNIRLELGDFFEEKYNAILEEMFSESISRKTQYIGIVLIPLAIIELFFHLNQYSDVLSNQVCDEIETLIKADDKIKYKLKQRAAAAL